MEGIVESEVLEGSCMGLYNYLQEIILKEVQPQQAGQD